MKGILKRSYLFCLSSVSYLDQEEIKLCKKSSCSYSIRLAFHVPASYHLTIFIYYLGLWSRHLKSYPLSVKTLGEKSKLVTFGSRTCVTIRSYGRVEAWAALSFKLIGPCVFAFVYFCFGFKLLLSRACF